jgi:hypothetical protein
MRVNGICYDTGFFNLGHSTHEPWDPEVVRRDMLVIRNDLHCTAVRVTGGDADRLETAAKHAADAGLEVWFCPFTCDLTTGELLEFLTGCAERAERLRADGAEVVMVTGSELALSTIGFVPGDTIVERLGWLTSPTAHHRERLAEVPARINDFLGKAVDAIRARFGGKVSYASLPFEGVDWAPFDYIGTDAGYWSAEVAEGYRESVRAFVAQGKPVAITEFGCVTVRGAAELGARGDTLVEWSEDDRLIGLTGEYTRDESEQATLLPWQLDIFDAEGVDSAFVNGFVSYIMPHRGDALADLDLASYGIVKVREDRQGAPWEPKAGFHALAACYRE